MNMLMNMFNHEHDFRMWRIKIISLYPESGPLADERMTQVQYAQDWVKILF